MCALIGVFWFATTCTGFGWIDTRPGARLAELQGCDGCLILSVAGRSWKPASLPAQTHWFFALRDWDPIPAVPIPFMVGTFDSSFGVILPLWMVFVPALAATSILWWRDRRRRPGSCAACAYDLAGLAAGASCPECGEVATATLRQVKR